MRHQYSFGNRVVQELKSLTYFGKEKSFLESWLCEELKQGNKETSLIGNNKEEKINQGEYKRIGQGDSHEIQAIERESFGLYFKSISTRG